MAELKPGDRVRVTVREYPTGTWTGIVRKIRERPLWPSGADVVIDLDNMETWSKATRNLPGQWGDPTFRRDQVELLGA